MTKFQQEIENVARRIKRQGDEILSLLLADRLMQGIDLSDIRYFSVYGHSDTGVGISLQLDQDKKNSKLAHKIAQKLGCNFAKSQAWDKESLSLRAEVPESDDLPAFVITIDGSVPDTCKLIIREIPLTDDEIEEARRTALENIKTVRIEREISCG